MDWRHIGCCGGNERGRKDSCMYVFMYVCMYACMHWFQSLYACACVCMYGYMCIILCVSAKCAREKELMYVICTCQFVSFLAFTNIRCLYLQTHKHVKWVYIHTHIRTHTNTHTHTHTCTYIPIFSTIKRHMHQEAPYVHTHSHMYIHTPVATIQHQSVYPRALYVSMKYRPYVDFPFR